MPAALHSALFVIAAGEPAAQPISVQTALLIILGIGLLLTVKSLVDLQRRVDRLTAAARPKSTQRTAPSPEPISPEILAVITAAAYEAIGADHHIVSISSSHQSNSNWSQEGRRQVFAGRKVR